MRLGADSLQPTTAGLRSDNLDILRALAALGVLAGHAYLLSGTSIGFHDRHPVRLAINSGGAGVWLFFAVSGYLISGPFVRALHTGAPLPDVRGYARRRMWRIYPAYWIAFAAIVLFALPGAVGLTWKQLLVHGALLHNLRPGWQQAVFFGSWTLTLEVLFYVAVPVTAVVLRRVVGRALTARELTWGVVGLWLGSVTFVAVVPHLTSGTTQLWLRILFPSMVSMFCPGILLAVWDAAAQAGVPPRPYTWLLEHRRVVVVAIAVLCVGGALGATLTPLRLYDLARQQFAVAFGLVVLLATTRGPVARAARVFTWFGVVSYGIYLWQGVVIYLFDRHESLIPLHDTSYLGYLVHVAVLLAITLPFAYLSWRLVERPGIERSRRPVRS